MLVLGTIFGTTVPLLLNITLISEVYFSSFFFGNAGIELLLKSKLGLAFLFYFTSVNKCSAKRFKAGFDGSKGI